MSRYQPILATLGYVFSPDRSEVLLVHRNARAGDDHFGKYNGLGGKLLPGEDVITGMRREIQEESGILCHELELAGTINWPGFGSDGTNWFGFLFRIFAWSGTLLDRNEEGTLGWHSLDHAAQLPMWEGDRYFLPLIFDFASPQFHGVMPYHEGRPTAWTVSRCGDSRPTVC